MFDYDLYNDDALSDFKFYKNISGIKSLISMGYEPNEILESYLGQTRRPLQEKILDLLVNLGCVIDDNIRVLPIYCTNPKADVAGINLLFDLGAQPITPPGFNNLLHNYVQFHSVLDESVVDCILDHGIDINSLGTHNEGVLFCIQDCLEVDGVPPHEPVSKDKDLFSARLYSNLKLLLQKGANWNIRNENGQSFIHRMMIALNGPALAILKIVELLKSYDIDLNPVDDQGKYPADYITEFSGFGRDKLIVLGFKFHT